MELKSIFNGRETVYNFLQKSYKKDTLSHAYLFVGQNGIGKNSIAHFFAKMLLCESSDYNAPCDMCSGCVLMNANNHPDYHVIAKEDGEKSIKINQIRELENVVQKSTYRSNRLIVFIKQAELMTEQAQNALLKTLEEPPKQVVILMTANSMSAILTTIQSRCQIVSVPIMPYKHIEQFLINKGIDLEKAHHAAKISQGLPNKALALADSDTYGQTRKELILRIGDWHNKNISDMMSEVDFFVERKDSINQLLDIMESVYRDVMVYCEIQQEGSLFNSDEIAIVKQLSGCIKTTQSMSILSAICLARKRIKENTNVQLTIEELLLTIKEEERHE